MKNGNMIDWKGRVNVKIKALIRKADITPYFRKIFQSEKQKITLILKDVLQSYQAYVPFVNMNSIIMSFLLLVKKVGSGISFDGIPAQFFKCYHLHF